MLRRVPQQQPVVLGEEDAAVAIAGDLVWIVGIGAALWAGSTIYKEIRGRS